MTPSSLQPLTPRPRPAPEALVEINALPRLARVLQRLMDEGGAVPADAAQVQTAVQALGETDLTVSAEQLDALVALGVLERVVIGKTLHLTWHDQRPEAAAPMPASADTTAPVLAEDDLRFRLDVALDVEHERLLFYRVLLVLEVLAGLLLLRAVVLWYLQG